MRGGSDGDGFQHLLREDRLPKMKSSRHSYSTRDAASVHKSVLYWAPGRARFIDLRARLLRVSGCSLDQDRLCYRGIELGIKLEHHAADLLDRLHSEYFNLVLLDLRSVTATEAGFGAQVRDALDILDAMDSEPDVEAHYGFHRVVVLVSGEGDGTDQLIARLGARHVGRVVRGPAPGEPFDGASDRFAQLALDEMLRLMLERRPGLRALCCSGGGITGIYFELGALKCLDDCLRPGSSVNAFDLYFGISAGAVVCGLLANGYSVDDCMAAIAGLEGGRIPPMSLSIIRLHMLDAASLRDRLLRGLRTFAAALWRTTHGKGRVSIESLLLDYSDFFGPPLRGDRFEQSLREIFSAPGYSNDFRMLPKRLYIGATDQDQRTHVLFGTPGNDDVPVSLAVQASTSLHPAFAPTRIKDRYYCDGAVTATSHIQEAIHMGADLLFVIDPFLPYVSKDPGYVRTRGILYNIDQDVRTLSYTRFERMREAALRRHPGVSAYTFVPANSLRKRLSVNPMDHRPFFAVWRGAYLSTLRRILHLRYRMEGDLALHGLALDTARAEEVAARLRACKLPSLNDFYPNGKIDMPGAPCGRPALLRKREAFLEISAALAAMPDNATTISSELRISTEEASP